MKTRTSVTTIQGKDTNVTHTEPSLDEIVEAVGKERAAKIIVDYVNRHQFLPACRKAGDVLQDSEATKDAKAEAYELMSRIENHEVFDILEFLSSGRSSKPTKDDLANAKVFLVEYGKGTFTQYQIDQAYGKLGLNFKVNVSDEEMIEQHARYLQAKRKAAKAQVL